MNLVLDLDGTLVDKDEDGPIARPYLEEFLQYVFHKFARVSVWTNASPEWCNHIMNDVIKPLLPDGKRFDFVWTRDRCVLEPIVVGSSTSDGHQYTLPVTRKPLLHIYRHYPDIYSESNTLIVDDTPDTYVFNQDQAIPIVTFRWGEASSSSAAAASACACSCSTADGNEEDEEVDKELLRLIAHFDDHVFSDIIKHNTPSC